jgi:5-methylcytosine-specific restriction endonuclease McrA
VTYICPVSRRLGSNWRHQQRLRVHRLQGGQCHWCNRYCTLYPLLKKQMTIDHVIPVCEGGSNEEDNLVGACYYCNMKRAKEQKKRLNANRTRSKGSADGENSGQRS